MAAALQDIINQLQTQTYQPEVDAVTKQQADLPGQVADQEQGLQAKQTTAFSDILNQARARGTGVAFGGIPLSDQAKYTADTYLPALANLHTAQTQQAQSLQDALNKIYEARNNQAQSIYQFQTQQDATAAALEEQKREFDAQQAAAAKAASSAGSGFNPSYSDSGSTSATQTTASAQSPSQQQQSDFNFVKGLIDQVNGGNGTATALIISQAKAGDARSKDIMRAFYQLQNKPIPVGFRGFL